MIFPLNLTYKPTKHFDTSSLNALSSVAGTVSATAMNGAFQAAANEETIEHSNYWNTMQWIQHEQDKKYNSNEAEIARQFSATEAEKARQFASDEAQKTRDYNSPANQVKLMQEAGLNPNGLDYSGSSAQASTAEASPSSASSPSGSSFSNPTVQAPPPVTNPIDAYNSALATQADIRLKDSSTHQNYVDAEIKKIKSTTEISEMHARIDNYIQAIKTSKADASLKQANATLLRAQSDALHQKAVTDMAETYISFNRLNLDITSQANQKIMLQSGIYKDVIQFKQAEEFYYKQLKAGGIKESFNFGSRTHHGANSSVRTSASELTKLEGDLTLSSEIPFLSGKATVGASETNAFGQDNQVGNTFATDDATQQNEKMADLYAKLCATSRLMSDYPDDVKLLERLSKQLKTYQADINEFQVFIKAMTKQVGLITTSSNPE